MAYVKTHLKKIELYFHEIISTNDFSIKFISFKKIIVINEIIVEINFSFWRK